MKLGLLSNEKLARGVNWTLLSDPLFHEFEQIAETLRLAPPPLGLSGAGTTFREMRRARSADALVAAGPSKTQYIYLPFAADLNTFQDTDAERDIDILSMGRRSEPLHEALLELSDTRGLNYLYREKTGFLDDPRDLGKLAARARYFVVSPPPPERSGGFSPVVMRYFEGLAAGCRLLGDLPGSGEFEELLPVRSLLEVKSDGSDLAEKFAADQDDQAAWAATAAAARIVREKHGWDSRTQTIMQALDEFAKRAG